MQKSADTINLGFLTGSERELILEVLRRDKELRQAEEQRVRKLKAELQDMKKKGAKIGTRKYSQHSCGRCQEPLSRLNLFSSQCKMCNHSVCRNCRAVLPNGSWLCTVCAKEMDLKKMVCDWFYDNKFNRYSTKPGHKLVRRSLYDRHQLKPHETMEARRRSTEAIPDTHPHVFRPRQNNPNKSESGSIGSRDSFDSKGYSARSDSESAENTSLSSIQVEPEPIRRPSIQFEPEPIRRPSIQFEPEPIRRPSIQVEPEPKPIRASPRVARQTKPTLQLIPVGSNSSSVTAPADGISIRSSISDISSIPEVRIHTPSPELEVDPIFKKSIRRSPKPTKHASSLELRDNGDTLDLVQGDRRHSVPGFIVQEDEEEDIDSLVKIHKKKLASSSSSLHSSKSTLGSMTSIYSEAGDYDSVDVSGDVVFSLKYDEHTQNLHVFIKQCHGLANGDTTRQLSNPYVKCYLLPDKSRQSKRKTSIMRHTVNPVYNETLKYSISRSQLFTRSLSLSVWHYGRFSRNTFLGEVEIPLDTRDLDSPQEERMPLTKASSAPTSAFPQYKGELVISLKYVTPKKPTADKIKGKKSATEEGGELHVLIKEAKNLMPMKVGGTTDSFVKGYMLPAKPKFRKRKTLVVKKNLNPHYDHTFVYKEVTLEELDDMCLELTVWDKVLMSNEFLGGTRLSSGKGTVKVGKEEVRMDSVGEEVCLWQKMMQYPDSWAEGTLPLRSSMGMVTGD